MDKDNKFINQDIIFSELDRLGFEYKVLGGFGRSSYYGEEPNDMDVFIYNLPSPFHYKIDIFKDFCEKNQYLEVCFDNRKTKLVLKEGVTKCTNYTDRRIETVIKLNNSMDIIFYQEDFQTHMDIINSFDFNINQWAMLADPEGTYHPVYLGKPNNKVLKKLKPVSVSRNMKMYQIAQRLGWSFF